VNALFLDFIGAGRGRELCWRRHLSWVAKPGDKQPSTHLPLTQHSVGCSSCYNPPNLLYLGMAWGFAGYSPSDSAKSTCFCSGLFER